MTPPHVVQLMGVGLQDRARAFLPVLTESNRCNLHRLREVFAHVIELAIICSLPSSCPTHSAVLLSCQSSVQILEH